MECTQFQSVVALVDYLVRSSHARRSRVLLPSLPIPAPVSNKSLTDFSICSILGRENDVTQSSSSSGKLEHSLYIVAEVHAFIGNLIEKRSLPTLVLHVDSKC